MRWPWLPISVVVISWFGTRLALRYATSQQLFDTPNSRSLHSQPTPRGGGVGFVFASLIGVVLAYASGLVAAPLAVAGIIASLMVAAIGFLDDHRSVPPALRLIVHFAAAGIALWNIGIPRTVELASGSIDLGLWAGSILASIAFVWLVNLFNFMDGADGLAATEAITVALSAIVLGVATDAASPVMWVAAILASAVLGFLPYNWAPARIFMGDVGSGFLGALIAVCVIESGYREPAWLWIWAVLLAVFVTDASFTLFQRMWRRVRVFDAHREHGYQRLALRWQSHRLVSIAIAQVNCFWLLPVAALAAFEVVDGPVAALMAYLPLIFCVYWLDRDEVDPGCENRGSSIPSA